MKRKVDKLQKNGIKPGKPKQSDTYFAGTKTVEMVRKLMGLKKDYINYRKLYILGTQVQLVQSIKHITAFAITEPCVSKKTLKGRGKKQSLSNH